MLITVSIACSGMIVYFECTFSATLNSLCNELQTELKFINAPFTNYITSSMICRLMLNLRRKASPPTRSIISAPKLVIATDRGRDYIDEFGDSLDLDSFDKQDRRERARLSRATAGDSDWNPPRFSEEDYEMKSFISSPLP
jgi:hypothetical protein